MAKAPCSLDYAKCSEEELEAFILRRGLGVPDTASQTSIFMSAMPRTSPLITTLRDADRNSRFRFEDLPPEMRNMVYRELLLFHDTPPKGLRCWPQILSASSNLKREASGILYDENLFSLSIANVTDSSGKGAHKCTLQMNGANISSTRQSSHDVAGFWPTSLRKASRLEIRLALSASSQESTGFQTANHYLYSLCSLLQDKHRLKELSVRFNVEPDQYMEIDYQQSLLHPLRKLGSIPSFTLTGVSKGVKEFLDKAMRVHSVDPPHQNPLELWQHLTPQIQRIINLAAELDRERFARGEKGHLAGVKALRHAAEDVQCKLGLKHCMFDATWETDFEERVMLVESLVVSRPVLDLKKAVEQRVRGLSASLANIEKWEAERVGGTSKV